MTIRVSNEFDFLQGPFLSENALRKLVALFYRIKDLTDLLYVIQKGFELAVVQWIKR